MQPSPSPGCTESRSDVLGWYVRRKKGVDLKHFFIVILLLLHAFCVLFLFLFLFDPLSFPHSSSAPRKMKPMVLLQRRVAPPGAGAESGRAFSFFWMFFLLL